MPSKYKRDIEILNIDLLIIFITLKFKLILTSLILVVRLQFCVYNDVII